MAGLLGDFPEVLDLRTGKIMKLDPVTGMPIDPVTGNPIDDTGQPAGLLDPKNPNTGGDGKTGGKLPNSGPTIAPWFPPGYQQRPMQLPWMPPPHTATFVPPSASFRRR